MPKAQSEVESRQSDIARSHITETSVRILHTAEEIESIRGFWSACSGERDSDIDILLALVRGDQARQRPHVLVVEEDGKPTALMAGRVIRRQLAFRIGYFNIFKSLASVMTFPYGSLRGEASSHTCEQLVRMIVRSLKAGEADLALLEYVDADSNLYRWCKQLPGIFTRDYFAAHRHHRKRMLPRSVEKLYASLSSHERKRFRQIQRKLNNAFPGQVRIDRLLCAEDLDRSLRVVEEISEKTWQGQMGKGVKAVGPLRDLFQLEAQKGWLRIYTLYVADQPCAFWIGSVYQATFYSDFVGFDPAYSDYSPGMYLLSQMMEEFCTQDVEAIDFGFTDDEYKRRFGNVVWREASLHIFAPSSKGVSVNLMRAVAFLVHEPARALLARTNLIERAKKIGRRMASEKNRTKQN